jgi:hypothetical protein
MMFEGFVNRVLNMQTAMVDDVEIIEQDEYKVIIKMSHIYPAFKTQGEMLDVSYGELLKWMEVMYISLAEHIGCTYSHVMTGDGLEMTIGKK